jgi:hypothetical protein
VQPAIKSLQNGQDLRLGRSSKIAKGSSVPLVVENESIVRLLLELQNGFVAGVVNSSDVSGFFDLPGSVFFAQQEFNGTLGFELNLENAEQRSLCIENKPTFSISLSTMWTLYK